MHHHQDARVVGQLGGVLGHRLHIEELAHLRERLLLGHAHHRVAAEAHPVDDRHHRLAAVSELGHEAGEVVFEKGFAVRREHIDARAPRRRVGRSEAEEQLFAAGALEGLDSVGDRPVFILGERPGIDDLQHDVAIGRGGISVEHGADAARERGELRRLLGERAREEQAEPQRLVDFAEQRARALAQRIEVLLGEVDAGAAQDLRADDVDANEDHYAEQRRDRGDAAGGGKTSRRRPAFAGAGRVGLRRRGIHLVGHLSLTPLS